MVVDFEGIRREMIESSNGLFLGDLHSICVFLVLLAMLCATMLFLSPPPVLAIAVGVPLVGGSHQLYNLLRVKFLEEIPQRQWWVLAAGNVALGLVLAVLAGWAWPVILP